MIAAEGSSVPFGAFSYELYFPNTPQDTISSRSPSTVSLSILFNSLKPIVETSHQGV